MLLRVPKRQQPSTQQRRRGQVKMIIGKGAELDHGAMLPQDPPRCQTQKAPAFQLEDAHIVRFGFSGALDGFCVA
jgi:hypothetical protein